MQRTIQRARSLRKNLTIAEKKLWYEIRNNRLSGLRFRRQVPFGSYIVDFACFEPKIIIELDGSQHANEAAVIYDQKRTTYLESLGYHVLRFWNHEILKEIDRVKEVIWDQCFSIYLSASEA